MHTNVKTSNKKSHDLWKSLDGCFSMIYTFFMIYSAPRLFTILYFCETNGILNAHIHTEMTPHNPSSSSQNFSDPTV